MTNAVLKDLFEKTKKPVLSYLQVLIVDKNAAEQVAEDFYLQLYREKKFVSWETAAFWQLLRQVGLAYWRRRTQVVPESHLDLVPVHEGTDANLETFRNASGESIRRGLSELSIAERDALAMRLFAPLTEEALAKVLQLMPSEVSAVLNRAKWDLLNVL